MAVGARASCRAPETTGGARARPIVWHLSLTNPASDRVLTDEEWGRIARGGHGRHGVHRGRGKAPVRWVAIRHGLSARRQRSPPHRRERGADDGTRPSVFRDYKTMSAYAASVERDTG